MIQPLLEHADGQDAVRVGGLKAIRMPPPIEQQFDALALLRTIESAERFYISAEPETEITNKAAYVKGTIVMGTIAGFEVKFRLGGFGVDSVWCVKLFEEQAPEGWYHDYDHPEYKA